MAAGTLTSSGSSGNMPTGSGSERLRRATIQTLNNDNQTILTGVAGHIYTMLLIKATDQNNNAQTLTCWMNDGTQNISIFESVSLPAYGTFVFSDRFVLEEDDTLTVHNSGANTDWLISYIDQDWT